MYVGHESSSNFICYHQTSGEMWLEDNIMIKDMTLGKQNSWIKAYNRQRKLPISKQTLSNVAEEIQHTVEVVSSHLFHDLYFFIIIKLTCETNFHKWNNNKLLLL
jgi:tmRNA-binding protein